MEKKKPYEKPTVTKVQLKADEAALTACKLRNSGGPFAAICTPAGCSRASKS